MTFQIILRDYQEDGVSGIRIEFRNKNDPVVYVLSAGGGKTYTFSYIAASAADKGHRVVIIVHRKELLLQASASLSNLGLEHGMISPHFTPKPFAKIQVASVDTLLIRIKSSKILAAREAVKSGKPLSDYEKRLLEMFQFDLLIFDEGHHVVYNNKWGRLYEELGKPKTLLVTATPVRGDKKGMGEHAGGICKSMVEGPKTSDLIARGVLCMPVVYTSVNQPDVSDVKKNKDGEYNEKQLAERVDRPKITGDAVAEYKKICPGVKAVVFCVNVKHAQHVVDEFNKGGFRFALLVGEPYMSDAQRTATDKALRAGEIDGVCTVDLISEGYDLPNLACVIMLRPTASESLFIQQAWRGGRADEGKTEWYLLDQVGNVGQIVDGQFKRKHGLPQEDREWTLDGGLKKKKNGKAKEPENDGPAIKQCDKCYTVFEATKAVEAGHDRALKDPLYDGRPCCPSCGAPVKVAERKIEQVEGVLHQVTEAMQERQRQQQRSAQSAAKSVEDMMHQLGYSRGRAEAILKAREEKSALSSSLLFDLRDWRTNTGQDLEATFGIKYLSDLKAYKPKALRELRERFDAHRASYTAGRTAPLMGELFSQPGQEPAF